MNKKDTGARFERAVAILARLRAPGGCPWDREQTFSSIQPYTLEETYEVLEAIDREDWDGLRGELGDLLLQVLFYAQMAGDDGRFDINDVLDQLSEKLIARHPHVFGDTQAATSRDVVRNWEALKREERSQRGEMGAASILHGISRSMPALMEALKISRRAADAGFDWPEIAGLFDKLDEEIAELKQEVARHPAPGPVPQGKSLAGARGVEVPGALRDRLEDEVGDLLFVLVNIARYLSLDPETALRKTNAKFRVRFTAMESELQREGRRLEDASLEELERLWQEAKSREREGRKEDA